MVQYLNIIAKINELKKFTETFILKIELFSIFSKIKSASIKSIDQKFDFENMIWNYNFAE